MCTLFFVGCDTGPRVHMVTGIVTLNGELVSGATVTFTPKEGSEEAILATGITDSDGRYALTAMQVNKFGRGTTVGEYLVTISKRGEAEITMVVAGTTHITEEFLVPIRYAFPDQSGLTATVVPGPNRFDFDLTD